MGVHDGLHIGRDGHPLQHADVAAAGIAQWDHANGRPDGTKDNTNRLPDDGAKASSTTFHQQHVPMGANMGPDERLTDDVGPLQMPQFRLNVSGGQTRVGQGHLGVEGLLLPGTQAWPCRLTMSQISSSRSVRLLALALAKMAWMSSSLTATLRFSSQ